MFRPRSFSVLAPVFLHFPLLPDRRSRSFRAVHSGDRGRARRCRRRLREARRGRDRGENAESPLERSRLPSSSRRQRGPPTRSPVPLPRSQCSLLLQSGTIEGTMSSLNFVLKTVRMLM